VIGYPKPKKQDRLEKRILRLKEKVKAKKQRSLADLKKYVQKEVNKYIRERDKNLPCISCGRVSDTYHAGHYINQGSGGFLRYNPLNIHKQCAGCNLFKHGNLIEYRIALIQKIGIEKVEWLENNRHQIKKWTRDELESILLQVKKGVF
jgi:hypothetical protein